jgi:predicted ATPase/class 3 adenylate cyclase
MNPTEEIQKLLQGIAALEAQRAIIGEAIVETALAPLRERLASLRALSQSEQQRKMVTVLFADISGFTALSENLDAEDIGELMNAVWKKLDAAILSLGGHIDKHLGDGVMALWGAETSREDDPELAVRAALEMQQILTTEAYGYSAARGASSALKMRIGINTGQVLLGSLGTQGEYTAMGDTVNVASRLEQASPVGGILISHDTYWHVSGVFDLLEREPLLVKGKSEPLQTYLVERVRPRGFQSGSRGVEGIETHMVGRTSELETLQLAVEKALDGHSFQFLLVTGEVGMGKSRLLHEFQKSGSLLPSQTWIFKVRTEQQRQFIPYSLLRDLFSDRFEIQESDSLADARLKLEQGVCELLGPEGLADAHFIGQLIGLEYSESPFLAALGADPRALYDRSGVALMNFFRTLAAQKPLIFLVEDLHWADRNSMELLLSFVDEFQSAPVLLTATARPVLFEYYPVFSTELAHLTRLELQPLSRENSHRLVRDILRKVPSLPMDLLETVTGHADGNPFFIEELVKMLIENGAILKGETAWAVDVGRLHELRVPPTLIGVLQARLDRLSAPEKVVLHRASVVGRIFWGQAVSSLEEAETILTPQEVPAALKNLCSKELVFVRAQSTFSETQEYLFKNSILRDVTYEQVLKSQRRLYHHQAAGWLIEQSGDRANEYAALIAEHFDRAGENDSAAEWYCRAAQAVEDSFAQETVIGYYQRALSLLGPGVEAARLIQPYLGMGMSLHRLTRSAEALQAFQAAFEHARKIGEPRAQLRALHGFTLVYEFQGDYAEVVRITVQAEALLQVSGLDDRLELAQILLEKARAYYYQGKYASARQAGVTGLEVALAADARIQIARLYNVLGMVMTAEGDFEQAIAYKSQSLERWRALGNKMYIAAVLNNVGENYRIMGAYEQAMEYYQQSLETARELHDIGQVVICLNNLGGAYVGLGQFQLAVETLEQIFTLSQEKTFTDAESYSFLAEAYLGLDQLEKALAAAQNAVTLCLAGDEAPFGGNAWRVLGRVAFRLEQLVSVGGQVYGAVDCFARSMKVNRKTGVPRDQALTLWDWARFSRAQGDLAQAAIMWREAQAIFERLRLTYFSSLMEREWPDPAG